jgi:hypothetical protein
VFPILWTIVSTFIGKLFCGSDCLVLDGLRCDNSDALAGYRNRNSISPSVSLE